MTTDDATESPPVVPSEGGPRPGRPLGQRVAPGTLHDPDEILDRFLEWALDRGLELYPAQEEGLLELMSGRHVVLNTPTGSGKSLVALGLQWKGLCEGKRSYYTSPIKALASEKFFSLCSELGAENVGMLTGDASINPEAPVICCTAEVLSNLALRLGEELSADYVIMDEFHYYSDPERGVAWQVPLITLPRSQFLLMSATLGNTAFLREDLERRTGVGVAHVSTSVRPVPLDYEYRETSLHETVEGLVAKERVPVYIVNFTQRECAELAQSVTSMKVASREDREKVWQAIADFRFDTPYGKELKRFLGFGIAVHHAGLLPKYRLLVEQLAQQGLLKVICGTDTLGVGVNVPIRTVLFNKLAKYDGSKVGILTVRDFRQIAGRAGRKGFDDRGHVVVQAPARAIERRKAELSGKKKKKPSGSSRQEVEWSEETFQRLQSGDPEPLESRFTVTHGMVLDLIQRDAAVNDPDHRNFHSLRQLIERSHAREVEKGELLQRAAQLVRSLGRTGILRLEKDRRSNYRWVVVDQDLQLEFSLHQTLSPWLVEALETLDAERPEYATSLLSFVEAILENPRIILLRQADHRKTELMARMKAEGVPYEERIERLEEVSHPTPCAEEIFASFDRFREEHVWVRGENPRPKSIGRELFENYWSFADFIRRYGLQRSEGILLRYLSQLYKTLVQNVPERFKTEEVYDLIGFLRTLLETTDTSLLEEWESLLHPELRFEEAGKQQQSREALRSYELFHDPRAFQARVRAELHQLVRSLAREDWDGALGGLRSVEEVWTQDGLMESLGGHSVVFDHEARRTYHTRIEEVAPRRWSVEHTLRLRPPSLTEDEGGPASSVPEFEEEAGEDECGTGVLRARIDLGPGKPLEGPLLELLAVET